MPAQGFCIIISRSMFDFIFSIVNLPGNMAISLGNPVLFLMSLFLKVAFAQQSTMVTLIDMGGYESLAALVVAVDATATTY